MTSFRVRGPLVALLIVGISGCQATPEIAGLVVGGAAGGASANPVVGFAVGLGVRTTVAAGRQYVQRRWQTTEQDQIATAAAGLPEGGTAAWHVEHDLPIDEEGGSVQVVRDITTPLATCREIAFSVNDGDDGHELYTAAICKDGEVWRWASAEPAVARWGLLQ